MKIPSITKSFSNPVARASALVAIVITLVAGVTFATLQSQVDVIKGNDIRTATANLLLSSDGATYSNQLMGYSFDNVVPGGALVPANGYPVSIKNAGSTPLAVKLSVGPNLTNTNNVDLSKVYIILTPTSGGTAQNFSLQSLIDGDKTGGVSITQASHVFVNNSLGFTMQMSMDSDAVNGPSGELDNLDINFNALAV